jgi:hypothetical protein
MEVCRSSNNNCSKIYLLSGSLEKCQARTSRQKEAEALQRSSASPKEADDEFMIRLRRLRYATMSIPSLILSCAWNRLHTH